VSGIYGREYVGILLIKDLTVCHTVVSGKLE